MCDLCIGRRRVFRNPAATAGLGDIARARTRRVARRSAVPGRSLWPTQASPGCAKSARQVRRGGAVGAREEERGGALGDARGVTGRRLEGVPTGTGVGGSPTTSSPSTPSVGPGRSRAACMSGAVLESRSRQSPCPRDPQRANTRDPESFPESAGLLNAQACKMSERGRGRCAPGLDSPWLPPAAARSGAHSPLRQPWQSEEHWPRLGRRSRQPCRYRSSQTRSPPSQNPYR